MGIKDFLARYVGRRHFYEGFMAINLIDERIVIDAAGLLYDCALRHSSSYSAGNYTPALNSFCTTIIYLCFTLIGIPLLCSMDGHLPKRRGLTLTYQVWSKFSTKPFQTQPTAVTAPSGTSTGGSSGSSCTSSSSTPGSI